MHRLGDRFLAGAGLALQQDRRLGRRGLREQREQPLHRRGRAEHVAEPIARPVAELDVRVDRLDIDLGVLAEAQPRGAGQDDLADARAAVLGAVRRVEVADLDAVATHADLEVVARHGRVGEHEIVVGVRADHRRALVEHVLLALIGPGDDAQAEAALEQDPAGVVGEELSMD